MRDYVTRHPNDTFLIAFTLLQEGRVDEALNVAEESWPKADVNALAAESLELISYAGLTPAQIQRLERILLSIADKRGRPVALLIVVGELQMRLRPEDAVGIYREVLKKDDNNIFALNNLALLLALQKQNVDESLKLVDRALAIAGPVPAVLDTRAAVRMAGGQGEEALADLDEAIRDDPQPASIFTGLWPAGTRPAKGGRRGIPGRPAEWASSRMTSLFSNGPVMRSWHEPATLGVAQRLPRGDLCQCPPGS